MSTSPVTSGVTGANGHRVHRARRNSRASSANSLDNVDIEPIPANDDSPRLQNQDPLNPMQTSQIMDELGQMQQISASNKLTTTLDAMALGQSLTQRNKPASAKQSTASTTTAIRPPAWCKK